MREYEFEGAPCLEVEIGGYHIGDIDLNDHLDDVGIRSFEIGVDDDDIVIKLMETGGGVAELARYIHEWPSALERLRTELQKLGHSGDVDRDEQDVHLDRITEGFRRDGESAVDCIEAYFVLLRSIRTFLGRTERP
tara:strand:- start:240 stop:647 length:408 start_codon:yes stop_codon:yes gene_type:complete